MEGSFHKAKGTVKDMVGKLSDNQKLEAEGSRENLAGKIQVKVGKVKKIFGK